MPGPPLLIPPGNVPPPVPPLVIAAPVALNPRDQPLVNQLCDQCRAITQQMTARNVLSATSPAGDLDARVAQLFVLTAEPGLNKYLQIPASFAAAMSNDATTINGTPGAANPKLVARDQRQRVRQLIRQIAARQPHFRGLAHAQSRDLGELLALTGVEDVRTRASLDSLDRDIADLLHYASRGQHDAHAREETCQQP